MSTLQVQLKALENLQELDLKIESLKKRKAAIPGLLKSFEDEIKKFQLQLTTLNTQALEVEKIQKQAKAALDLNGDRQTRAAAKLSNVGNTTQYQAAMKESDQLKKSNGIIEEQLKKANDDLAAVQKKCVDVQALLEGAQEKRKLDGASIDSELVSLETDMAQMSATRGTMTPSIEKRILTHYDRVRGTRLTGLAPANGGQCRGCNMKLPPQMYNELLKWASLQSCPSCSRLLFATTTTTTVIQGSR